jgi:hypothetical protein
MRASRRASARTTTQLFAIEATQRDDGRTLVGEGLDAGGVDSTLPPLEVVMRKEALSAGVIRVTEAIVSREAVGGRVSPAGVTSVLGCVAACACAAGVSSWPRSSKPSPIITTSPAMPMRFQMSGTFGGGAGIVPHHLHDPTLSG